MPRPEAQTAFQKSLQVVFRALAHLKNQAHDSSLELNGIRIDMRQPCITFKNAEVSRCRTRQTSQIVEPFAERQPTAKLHPIGIDHLKPIFPAAIFTIKNVSDIQILVQDARFMHAKQKSDPGQTSERTNDSNVEQFGEILILMEVLVCTKNYGAHTLNCGIRFP